MVKEIPESYSECFEILGKNGIISQNLSEKPANMAKFRNLLVHVYWKIDDKKIYEEVLAERHEIIFAYVIESVFKD